MSATPTTVDQAEIDRALKLLVTPGSVFEVRAIAATKYGRGEEILSGYFSGDSAPGVVARMDTRAVVGWYVTLNPVMPALHARRADRIDRVGKDATTKDHHVERRTRILIDVDPVRPTGISSSDVEHEAALALISEMEDDLSSRGWPPPMVCDSGNGAHLIYAIDLPCDDDDLVAKVLAAAQVRWGCRLGDVELKIDASNANPARITKLYGTPARKGDSVGDRTHRLSRVMRAPPELATVSREQLEQFAAEFTPATKTADTTRSSAAATRSSSTSQRLDARDWLSRHGIAVKNTVDPWTDKHGQVGTLYELDECPFNSDHNRGEAHVEQFASGAISAGCHHDSCTWTWAELRERYEPRQRDEVAARRARKQRSAEPHVERPTDHPGRGENGGEGYGYRLTETGNALRFAEQHADRLRYVTAWKTWLEWDGRRWCRDNTGSEQRGARDVLAAIYRDAARAYARAAELSAVAANGGGGNVTDESSKWSAIGDALDDHARRTSTAGGRAALVKLAQSEEGIGATPDIFDRDDYLLNVNNGTIDLRNGELRPHRQSDLITRLAPVDYDPAATCPQWERFLAQMQPDDEQRLWLQRLLGYALTGDVREQVFPFWQGVGGNGKNVTADLVVDIMGDYATVGAPDLLLEKHGEAHPTELADLEGRRLVMCSEVEQGRQWAESRIKMLTGEKTFRARGMKENFREIRATAKLVVLANHKPKVRGTDNGMWRRMRLVPWPVVIPDREQDKSLGTKLTAERPGILRWLVDGAIAWQQQKLGTTKTITLATTGYRDEEDVIGLWIADQCDVDAAHKQSSETLYANYRTWCEGEGVEPWTRKTWQARLTERPGIVAHRDNARRGVRGLKVRGSRE